MVLTSILSIQVGITLAKGFFDLTSPLGLAGLRLTFAAAILFAWWRPRLPRDRVSWLLVIGFGTAIAGMNLSYSALEYLPVGVVSTLLYLGPFTIALLGAKRLIDGVWAVLAATGVVLLAAPSGEISSPIGVLLGVLAGASLGLYVVLSKRTGTRSAGGSLLTWAVAWAALLTLPVGIVDAGATLLRPKVLLAGLLVAVISAVIPYSLEFAALRRLPARVVGVLQSLEPAVGTAAGLIILGELLAPAQWIAVAFVTVASAGAVTTRRESETVPTGHACAEMTEPEMTSAYAGPTLKTPPEEPRPPTKSP